MSRFQSNRWRDSMCWPPNWTHRPIQNSQNVPDQSRWWNRIDQSLGSHLQLWTDQITSKDEEVMTQMLKTSSGHQPSQSQSHSFFHLNFIFACSIELQLQNQFFVHPTFWIRNLCLLILCNYVINKKLLYFEHSIYIISRNLCRCLQNTVNINRIHIIFLVANEIRFQYSKSIDFCTHHIKWSWIWEQISEHYVKITVNRGSSLLGAARLWGFLIISIDSFRFVLLWFFIYWLNGNLYGH